MIPKFRAWDKENKRWMTPEIEDSEESEIRLDLWGNVLFRLPWYEQSEGSIVTVYANDVFKIMQSSGLKDKNGVEIYEGDICWDAHNECFGEVIFDEGKFQYVWLNICEDLWEVTDVIEAVGNIYENPELLEVAE